MLLTSGCSLADLRTAQILDTGPQPEAVREGRRLLELAVWRQDKSGRWDEFEHWTVTTRDIWESGFIRRLTPLTNNDQSILFDFAMDQSLAEMTFLDGKRADQTLGVDQKGEFVRVDGTKEYRRVKKLANYLEPVRDYYFWPQTLVNSQTVLYAGEDIVGDVAYHKIFVTDGPVAPAAETDQYIVWLNKNSLRIEYIEFTLRSLLKSYRGVVAYSDYRDVEGLQLPHRLTLLDKVGSEDYSHEFQIQTMSFRRPQREIGFLMEIKPFSLDLGLKK